MSTEKCVLVVFQATDWPEGLTGTWISAGGGHGGKCISFVDRDWS